MRKLSQALNTRFELATDAGDDGSGSGAPASADGSPARKSALSGRKKWLIAGACAIVAVLVASIWLWILPAVRHNAKMAKLPPAVRMDPADLVLKEPEAFTISWFKEGNTRAEGELWLDITTAVRVDTENFSGPFWFYTMGFSEAAGRRFTLDYVSEYVFWAEDEYHMDVYPAADIWKDEHEETWEYGGGMPVQDILVNGYLICGHDEAGNKMSFRTYIDFTNAPRE